MKMCGRNAGAIGKANVCMEVARSTAEILVSVKCLLLRGHIGQAQTYIFLCESAFCSTRPIFEFLEIGHRHTNGVARALPSRLIAKMSHSKVLTGRRPRLASIREKVHSQGKVYIGAMYKLII